MKHNSFSQQFKQWSFKVSVSSIIFVSVVLLGGAIITLARPSSLNDVKSDRANHQLTAENWDYLVDQISEQVSNLTILSGKVATNITNITTLSGKIATNTTNITTLSGKIATNATNSVPAGAVMAFDLSTCPSGWTRFSAADNRFIMGASTNSKATGGSASITLSASQLPSHKHYLFVPSFLENKGRDHSSPQSTRSAIDDHKHSAGDNNYSMTVGYTNTTAPSYGLSSSVGNGTSIDIQNPYIKLIYCKKN